MDNKKTAELDAVNLSKTDLNGLREETSVSPTDTYDKILTLLKDFKMLIIKLEEMNELLNKLKVHVLHFLRDLVKIGGDLSILQNNGSGIKTEQKETSEDEKQAAINFKTSFKSFFELKLSHMKGMILAKKAVADIKICWDRLEKNNLLKLFKQKYSFNIANKKMLKFMSNADELINFHDKDNKLAENFSFSIRYMTKNFNKTLNENQEFEKGLLTMEAKILEQVKPNHQFLDDEAFNQLQELLSTSCPGLTTITLSPHRAELLRIAEEKLVVQLLKTYQSIEEEKKVGDQLRFFSEKLTMMLQRVEAEKLILEQDVQKSEKDVQISRESLVTNEAEVAQREGTVIEDAKQIPRPLYNQIVSSQAEDQAIEDAIYYVSEGLRSGRMELDQFEKCIRKLARKQFMLRLLISKCRSKAGLT